MERRRWDAKTKALIVIQWLKGKPIAEICQEHQISQAQFYKWRDQFLAESHRVFETADQSQRETHLKKRNEYLTRLVGELTVELKKSEDAS